MALLTLDSPNFDQPLHLMHSHHLRSEQRAALLARLNSHLRASGCNGQARQTASHILRHFDETAIQHHEDEEIDLFPTTLGAVPTHTRTSLRALTDHLAQQHCDLSRLWDAVRSQLITVIDGKSDLLDEGLCNRFHTICVAHIEHEEGELLPIAHRWLPQSKLELLGKRMKERRNVAASQGHLS
ncbi:MAG: hemerythrin domain-containing protein [Betaproteobacteria bacterium]|nr:hemerythrin domain-containing protein [Betaproteobacteria bacterium]